jgi:hypothetical protein
MDKYYVIKKQTKSEDRKAIYKLISMALFTSAAFYGGVLLFFEIIVLFDKFTKWVL